MRILAFLATFLSAVFQVQALDVATKAPDFTLRGSDGKEHKLEDYKGKLVVLEWFNNDCPFVKKHYESGNMQSLQQRFTEQGVVWLSVISSASGNQGYVDQAGAVALKQQNKSHQTAILFDTEGSVGRSYGAKTTPHMYLISKTGELLYQGAIDDKPSVNIEDIKTSRNYIAEALEASMSGKAVKIAQKPPYGCSVKY